MDFRGLFLREYREKGKGSEKKREEIVQFLKFLIICMGSVMTSCHHLEALKPNNLAFKAAVVIFDFKDYQNTMQTTLFCGLVPFSPARGSSRNSPSLIYGHCEKGRRERIVYRKWRHKMKRGD